MVESSYIPPRAKNQYIFMPGRQSTRHIPSDTIRPISLLFRPDPARIWHLCRAFPRFVGLDSLFVLTTLPIPSLKRDQRQSQIQIAPCPPTRKNTTTKKPESTASAGILLRTTSLISFYQMRFGLRRSELLCQATVIARLDRLVQAL